MVDLVCAAASVPPFFDRAHWDDRRVIDAGMTDQALMPDPDKGRTLVLLTRKYRNLPKIVGRIYVCTSDETPADKLDFTDPEKLRRAWELGEAGGRQTLESWARGDNEASQSVA